MRLLLRPDVSRTVAAFIIAATGVAVWTMSPGIGFDAAPGLLASEQRLAGRGNPLTEIRVADPSDLQRDRAQLVAWWPPGQQLAVHGLRLVGLSLEQSLHLITVATWAMGLAGWSLYHWLVLKDRRLLPWTIAGVALLRLSHTHAFQFTGGETLLWGVFPAIVLFHIVQGERRDRIALFLAAAAGCVATLLVVLKYSGGILAAGLGLGFVWSASAKSRWSLARCWLMGAAVGVGVLATTGILRLFAGANPATVLRTNDPFAVVTWGLFGPLDAMSDLTEAATTLARRAGSGPLSERTVAVISFGLAVLFAAWVRASARAGIGLWDNARPVRDRALRVAVTVTVTTAVALIVLRLANADISWEARHHQYGMYLLWPFVIEGLLTTFQHPGRTLQAATAVCLVVFLLLPATYGALVLARRTLNGPTGIDREWSRDGPGAAPPLEDFTRVPGLDRALVATISPRTALTFPRQRVLFVMTLREGELASSPDASWRTTRFKGLPAGGVALVLPPGVTAQDTATLKRSFENVQTWAPVRLEHAPAAQLWMGQ